MNTNKKLQEIIGSIIDKDYFKLEFGCKVKRFNEIFTWIGIEYAYAHYSKTSEITGKQLMYQCSSNFKEIEQFEIIGQEPTPDEILKALPHGWMMKHDKGTGNIEFINMDNFGKKSFKNQYFIWYGFGKTSEETKVALINLLENK